MNLNKFLSFLFFITIVSYFTYSRLKPETISLSSSSEPIIDLIQTANESVKMDQPKFEDLSCNCKIQDQTFTQLQFETQNECSKYDRNYLQPQIESFKKSDTNGAYTTKRQNSYGSSDVPLKCLLFTMKDFYNSSERNKEEEEKRLTELKKQPMKLGQLFGLCSSEAGTPKPMFGKPCLTEDYVYPIYNAFLDVTNCFGMDQKFFIPKILVESGFHINAKGPAGDAGIGQFTSPAIAEANTIIPKLKKQIETNTSPACSNLAHYLKNNPNTLMKNGKPISSSLEERCSFLTSPPNPIRSLIYYVALQKRQKDTVSEKVDQLEKEMKQAGLGDKAKFSRDKIKEILYVLSYNAGPSGASSMYKNWLLFRSNKHKKTPVTLEDLNFSIDIPDKYKDISKSDAEKEPLTLPQYLKVFGKNYVRSVYFQKQKIDRNLGEGLCTQNTYLQL